MESIGTDTDFDCDICPSLDLKYLKGDSNEKRRFFHEACDRCDNKDSHIRLNLCAKCQHIRIWHLLGCFNGDAWTFLYKCSRNSEQCDVCSFMIACEAKWEKGEENTSIHDDEFAVYLSTVAVESSTEPKSRRLEAAWGLEFGWVDLLPATPEEDVARPWSYIDWPGLRSYLSSLMASQKREATTHALPICEPLCGIHVIDVDQRCIIQLPHGAQYVALSYV
ncbi:hypothetical protein PTTW11_11309 [Pyrenophora teres f. teres]|uniref:Uncharacterized protein n=1 Tax=Pyrenophora teres f. teres TaxID=97479 RepID=A0A6S6WHN2_9PLEO|nr:hypothetical protein PTTW11_11309 [Pyrenophora teres f. teres]